MQKKIPVLFSFFLFFSMCAHAADTSKTITYNYPGNITLSFTENKFIQDNHKITQCKESICLIDNKPLWGSDGKLPETVLSKIIFKSDKYSVTLESSSMFDPLINNDEKSRFKVSHYFADTWKVKGEFSDGSGAYHAEWLVTKSGSVRTLLGDSELLYDSFDSLFNKK